LARLDGSGNAAWMLVDRMGSLRNVIDNTGTLIATIAYDGFGNKTSETNPASSGAYQYAGYRFDPETGLLRPDPTRGRVYDPFMGQWREFDPIGFDGRDANLRRYVGNNGPNKVDLTRQIFFEEPLQIRRLKIFRFLGRKSRIGRPN
jgi:RHS repeat-associated protein